MSVTSYDPDEKPQNLGETSIHFKHNAGLSFTLVFPAKVSSSFSKCKLLARLYLEEMPDGGGNIGTIAGSAIEATSNSEDTLDTSTSLASLTAATQEDKLYWEKLGEAGSYCQTSQEDQPYWEGPIRVARSIKKAIQSYEGDLSHEKLDEMIATATRTSAAAYINSLFNTRDYAKEEVEDKLLAMGYDKHTVQEIVQKAKEGNLINDERFSEVFIRSKIMDGWGPRKIEQALVKRGIVLNEVKGWPEEFIQQETEVERALMLIKNRSALHKNPFEKSVRFLASKGFSYDICKQAAQRLVDDLNAQEE